MKKIIFILCLVLVVAFGLFAKVTYNDLGGGKYSATLTYKNDTANQIYLIGSFQSWTEPGVPMTKNAEGRWEITIPMDKSKILYKFYNPELEGDKYVEDPEALEAVANPFGTKDAVLRRPRKPNPNGDKNTEPDEWNPVFSLYSRNYFYQRVDSNLTKNITTNGYAPANDKAGYWAGEYGTIPGDLARVRYVKGYMFFNNTAKFHGNVLKHFTIDVEVNAQGRYDWDFTTYWDVTTDVTRERRLQDIMRENGSDIVNMFFGALVTTNFDQLVFGWKTRDVDVFLGAKNGKNLNSKDPMLLVNGSKVGDKDSGAHNVEVLVHPEKVKGLNVNLGFAKSDPSTRKYMLYLDASYNILKQDKYTVGAIYYMASYSPSVLDSFVNATHALSLWGSLKPVKGLSISLQGAIQLPTRYWNQYYNNGFHDITGDDISKEESLQYRVSRSNYDFFANSAAYVRVGYTHKIFNVAYQLATGGSMFKGDLSKKGGLFSEEQDIGNEAKVTGEQSYLDLPLPYANFYSGSNGAQIRNDLKFNVFPIVKKKDLLKISFTDTLVVSKLEGVTMLSEPIYTDVSTDEKYYQKNRYQLDNVFNIGLQTKFKAGAINMLIGANAVFSLTVYRADAYTPARKTGTVEPGVFFTFNQAHFDMEMSNISKVLKSIAIHYSLLIDYYPGFYPTGTANENLARDTSKLNKIQWKKLFNQVIINAKFSNKIGVNLGFIARLYHGSGDDYDNDSKHHRWIYYGDAEDKILGLAAYSAVPEYFNFGLALGFTYTLPVKLLKEPLFYVNFSIGWDPFRDAKFGEEYQTIQANTPEIGVGDASDSSKGTQNNINLEESLLTIGLKWDF